MNFWFDLKYGWRLLMKSKGYSLMCASVIGLSVGLVVWAYSLLYSQLLKPLGFPDSDRWYSVQIAATSKKTANSNVDAYTYQELVKHNRSADFLGAFTPLQSDDREGNPVVLSEGQASTPVRAGSISPRLLAATRVPPLMGRVFEERDGQPNAAAVAVLSFDAWHNYFAADKSIIGKTTRIDSKPVQIIGVMPQDFFMFEDFELWMPMHMSNLAGPSDSTASVSPLILLGPNQNPEALANEMQAAVNAVNKEHPELFDATRQVHLIPALRMFTHAQTTVVSMVCLMAVALLLLGCVNISMVFLARLLERSRELALRSALGASRSRILRQCLIETFLIVVFGLLIGWGLAAIGVQWAQGIGNFFAETLATGRFPNLLQLRPIDMTIAILSASAIWLLSTLVPAWRIARQEAPVVLASSGKGTSGGSRNRAAGVIVGVQVLISSLVLVTCGNMVLAVQEEVAKPTGMNTAPVMITTYPTVFDGRYAQPNQRVRYWDELSASVQSKMPGSEVAFSTAVPTVPNSVPAAVEAQEGNDHKANLTLPVAVVSENYFKLMGINLRSGRLFDTTDTSDSLNVAVVDENIASRYWPGQNAIGKRVQLNPANNGPWLTIVGVVSSVAGEPYKRDQGAVYQSLRQVVPSGFQLVVKLPNLAADSRKALRAAAFDVDRDLPLHNLQMLDNYLAARNLKWTSLVQTFSAIALIAMVLAASGLFGLISRSVVQRTQEVGIRRALGATAWKASTKFVRQGVLYLTVALVGVGISTGLMPLMSRNIPNILGRVGLVTLTVVLLNGLVIFTASYLPGRRAVALEPGDALRYE